MQRMAQLLNQIWSGSGRPAVSQKTVVCDAFSKQKQKKLFVTVLFITKEKMIRAVYNKDVCSFLAVMKKCKFNKVNQEFKPVPANVCVTICFVLWEEFFSFGYWELGLKFQSSCALVFLESHSMYDGCVLLGASCMAFWDPWCKRCYCL